MSIAEKYARAMRSSHLEMKVEPGDLDVLIAAGLVRESLGTGLLRLRAEWDTIATMPNARTMMPHLKSASYVRGGMLAVASHRFGIGGDEAIELVAKLLDQWCDPNCPTCTGRGVVGGYGTPQNICEACKGSKRRELLWPEDQQRMAAELEDEMRERAYLAVWRIQENLRTALPQIRGLLRQ